jgi:hypothetical protein
MDKAARLLIAKSSRTNKRSTFAFAACGFADQRSSEFSHFSQAIQAFGARETASGGKQNRTTNG